MKLISKKGEFNINHTGCENILLVTTDDMELCIPIDCVKVISRLFNNTYDIIISTGFYKFSIKMFNQSKQEQFFFCLINKLEMMNQQKGLHNE